MAVAANSRLSKLDGASTTCSRKAVELHNFLSVKKGGREFLTVKVQTHLVLLHKKLHNVENVNEHKQNH
jgi:hypothetical protein